MKKSIIGKTIIRTIGKIMESENFSPVDLSLLNTII